MNRFDGTLARQLDLIDDPEAPETRKVRRETRPRQRPTLRLLQQDLYAELARRRRRAQIAARRFV